MLNAVYSQSFLYIWYAWPESMNICVVFGSNSHLQSIYLAVITISRFLEKSNKECVDSAIPTPTAIKGFESVVVSVLFELGSLRYLWLDSN